MITEQSDSSQTLVSIIRVDRGAVQVERRDRVAIEEPLEIYLSAGGATQRIAMTMRTPGADLELAAGFLYSEGIITRREDIRAISPGVESDRGGAPRPNVVSVALNRAALPDLRALERHFVTSSACGVCGRTTIDSGVTPLSTPRAPLPPLAPADITRLPGTLRAAQSVFETTGGLHAAALFTHAGELLALREDVGRHNAMDKLVGWALMQGLLPLADSIVLVSGRASFELVQKAAAAGIPIFCAISAPSSMAIATARTAGMTLIGFLREDRFNIYCGGERIAAS